MTMLIIGSRAMEYWDILPTDRKISDFDAICTFEEFQVQVAQIKKHVGIKLCVPLSASKFHVRDMTGLNYEFEIAWKGSTGAALLKEYSAFDYAPPDVQLALKLSHRYLKDSPHFLKTMRDIQHLRGIIPKMRPWLQNWLVAREKATYVYNHPKLNVDKETFFDDSVGYVYDHDTIHQTVALMAEVPAYTFYMQDGAQVMTDRDKFFSVEEKVRLYGVYEESCVLALERSQIPHNFEPAARYSFELALMKVCTSITSGWFREYAWENYDKVLALYEQLGENDYIERFKKNQHLLKSFK